MISPRTIHFCIRFFISEVKSKTLKASDQSQWAKAIFDKISEPRKKNEPGLISRLQRFQKRVAWNPSK